MSKNKEVKALSKKKVIKLKIKALTKKVKKLKKKL